MLYYRLIEKQSHSSNSPSCETLTASEVVTTTFSECETDSSQMETRKRKREK